LADDIFKQVNEFRSDIESQLEISGDVLEAYKEFFDEELSLTEAKLYEDNDDGLEGKNVSAYKLNRFNDIDKEIRIFVESRVNGKFSITDNWEEYLNRILQESTNSDSEREKESHAEKLNAIKIMAESKISVLTGGAGTGKTSTLASLCLSPKIHKDGIVILTPTGKARVVLDSKLNKHEELRDKYKISTVFQYLLSKSNCDWDTKRFYLTKKPNSEVRGKTVIIDECSMLTEEMMGAIAETAQAAARVILVGDPNQLPPIGAGKPFYEIVEFLSEKHPANLAKLSISNRQKSDDNPRLDVELAKLFTFDQAKETGSDILLRIANDNRNIEFIRFNNDIELHNILLKTICYSTNPKMNDPDDIYNFNLSLGGVVENGYMNFKNVQKIDSWQILSPYRNDPQSGSASINRLIQNKYRIQTYDGLTWKMSDMKPSLGSDGIRYGEKVISTQNHHPENDRDKYVANGEVGIVERLCLDKRRKHRHCIRYISQPDESYKYSSKTSDEDNKLELAYALTVHKAQGSGFANTILVINEPPNGPNSFITREMIYTALTRQKDKVFIIYNKDAHELKKYHDAKYSDLAQRLTNLFGPALIRSYEKRAYAHNLIYIARTGEPMRSKSEVIIYNELDRQLGGTDIQFNYETEIILDGIKFHPDFTIDKPDGRKIYWEHLGMLNNYNYRQNWERKSAIYKNNGISEENGNLIITKDESNGGIDSAAVAGIIDKLKNS
jgi:hypothetical protein